ncbi:MAG: DUF4830 domain-containing protein [Clostridia bacterium]|nr:DUF4830 domain-containing protein [Clostridia bacterium]
MFVVSLSSKIIKKIIAVMIAVCVPVGAVVLYQCFFSKNNIGAETVGDTVVADNGLLSFISGFGWEVIKEPDEIREIIIPVEFDDVYKNYNSIQIKQGYDLEKYAGERVKRWTFTVTNYPGYENEDFIKINILVYDGEVIGGDVCSVKLDGFMHGFAAE